MALRRTAGTAAPGDYSKKAVIGSNDALIGLVLKYVPVRDLFACSQVNSVWERVCHSLLRDKLKWVLCSSQALPLLKVVQKVRQSIPLDCVILLFKTKRQRHATFVQTRYGLNGCLVFNTVSTVAPLSRIHAFHLRSSKTYKVDQVNSSPRYHTPTKAKNHVRLSKLEAKVGDKSPKAHGLKRVSKFFRRLVTHEQHRSSNATFKHIGPGVFSFTSKLSVPLKDGRHFSTSYAEKATGQKLQVATSVLLAKMRNRSMEALLSLGDTLTDDSPSMVVVFQSDPVDPLVMQYVESIFSDFPMVILGVHASGEACSIAAANASTPPSRGRVTVMVLRLVRVESALKKISTPRKH
ncbi:uncharacterized protein LOC144155741 [Haemaphysalis longicornis]